MADGKLAADEMLLAVKVPADATPGQSLNVSSPDGRIFEVQVPPGSTPGSTINVIVKKPPPSADEAGLPVATSVFSNDGPTIREGAAPPDMESEPGDVQKREKVDSRSTAAAAGAAGAGAIVGAVVLGGLTGPLVAATMVGGAAMYATTTDGQAGEAVRTIGAKSADAAGYIYDKAEEHQVISKMQSAASATAAKAKEINDEYDLTGKAKAGASAAANKAAEVNEKYGITDKAAAATAKVAAKAAEVDKEHNISGQAAAAAVSAGMGAMSLFGKAKAAVSKAAADQNANAKKS